MTTSTTELTKSLNDWIVAQAQEVQNTLKDRIATDTPVNTGRAQAGWENTATINKVGDIGVINNDVPYVGYLEYGSSEQAPTGMVRVNIQKIVSEGSA